MRNPELEVINEYLEAPDRFYNTFYSLAVESSADSSGIRLTTGERDISEMRVFLKKWISQYEAFFLTQLCEKWNRMKNNQLTRPEVVVELASAIGDCVEFPLEVACYIIIEGAESYCVD